MTTGRGLVLVLHQIGLIVQAVDHALYRDFHMLQVPVSTEDRDFFGSGLATWTTYPVELYLGGAHA